MNKDILKKWDEYFYEENKEQREKDIEEFVKKFPKIPDGWVSVKDNLPSCYADDYFKQGYSTFKVKNISGEEFETHVGVDGLIWWYDYGKPNNITHWWNE